MKDFGWLLAAKMADMRAARREEEEDLREERGGGEGQNQLQMNRKSLMKQLFSETISHYHKLVF